MSAEITFKTARSGGKQQNVNKVETMVEGYWHVEASAFLQQKKNSAKKKSWQNKINADGFLLVKSQTEQAS